MDLTDIQCDSLYKAVLLCDVGKLSLPDESVHTPYTRLEANAQRDYHRHPVIAEATQLSIQPLAIAKAYSDLIDGRLLDEALTATEAKEFIVSQKGKWFQNR